MLLAGFFGQALRSGQPVLRRELRELVVDLLGGSHLPARSLAIEESDDDLGEVGVLRKLAPRPWRSKIRQIPAGSN